MFTTKSNSVVIALSAAGVLFILLGLIALACPLTRGMLVLQLDGDHTLYSMDVAGTFAIGFRDDPDNG
jgi:hypothetical protein